MRDRVAGGSVSVSWSSDSRPATCCCHARAWRSTTPSAASSSHRPAWNRLIRSGPPVRSCRARASSMSVRNACSSGFCREKYAPSGSSRCDSPEASASEHVREGDLASLDGHADAEVEPVRLARHRAGRHADLQRVARLPVGGNVPADLDDDIGGVGQQREHLGGEPHRVQAGQPCVGRELLFRPVAAQPQPLQRDVERVQHGSFRDWVPDVLVDARCQREPLLRIAYLVGPLPAHRQVVTVAVGRPQDKGGPGDGGRGEGSVGRRDRRESAQPRVELVAEPGAVALPEPAGADPPGPSVGAAGLPGWRASPAGGSSRRGRSSEPAFGTRARRHGPGPR